MWWLSFLKIGLYMHYQKLKILFRQIFQNTNKQIKIFYTQKTFYILPNTALVEWEFNLQCLHAVAFFVYDTLIE